MIGVSTVSNENDELTVNDPYGANGKAFGFVSIAGQLTDPTAFGNYTREYGAKCSKIGDVIEMILDFDKLELRYCINDKDYGKAHTINKESKYKGIVTFSDDGESVRLL